MRIVTLVENTTCYTSHCTGTAAFDFMTPIMGHRLKAITTGSVIEL